MGRVKISYKNKISNCLDEVIGIFSEIFDLKKVNLKDDIFDKITWLENSIDEVNEENYDCIKVLETMISLKNYRVNTLTRLKEHLIGVKNFLEQKIPHDTLKKLFQQSIASVYSMEDLLKKANDKLLILKDPEYTKILDKLSCDLSHQAELVKVNIKKMEYLIDKIKKNIEELKNQ
ncbi:MAG: hypothetical protein ACTSYQ_01515 [Candidatus Odinarchaeia archaeon]